MFILLFYVLPLTKNFSCFVKLNLTISPTLFVIVNGVLVLLQLDIHIIRGPSYGGIANVSGARSGFALITKFWCRIKNL